MVSTILQAAVNTSYMMKETAAAMPSPAGDGATNAKVWCSPAVVPAAVQLTMVTIQAAVASYVALFELNPGQMGWRWCQKCEGMYFAGASGAGLCPADGEHDGASSGAYVVDFVAASIFEDFTGGWWIYSGLSAQSLGEKLVLHDAVIAALETHHNGGEQLFTAILKSTMVSLIGGTSA